MKLFKGDMSLFLAYFLDFYHTKQNTIQNDRYKGVLTGGFYKQLIIQTVHSYTAW